MTYSQLRRFLTSEEGPTTAEYAILLALILLAIFGIVQTLGTTNSTNWSNNATRIRNATTGS
jgi:pilus assembly protein Flp/PilA